MITVSLDVSGAQHTIAAMIHKIDHFKKVDVGRVMSEWQVEDMHRHRPFTKRVRSRGTASTLVRPHSRYEVNRSKNAQRRVARRARRKRGFTASLQYRKWSTRPILRAELYAALVARMNDALQKLLTWGK
jgi:hypothetical protein